VVAAGKLLRASIAHKAPFTLLTLALMCSSIAFWSGDARSLSGETTQETACLLNHMANSPDKGAQQICLFGYPARQYLPQALSTLINGRKVTSLAWGGSFYTILGLIVFAYALFLTLGKNLRADLLTAISLTLFSHVYYFNHFLFHFEQSIFPLSFALIIAGLFMLYTRQKRISVIPLLTLASIAAIHSYTPSLSLVGLVIVISAYMLKANKPHRLILSWHLITIILALSLSFLYRQDLSFGATAERNISQRLSDLAAMHEYLLLGAWDKAFVSPLVHGAAVILFISMLLGMLGKKALAIAWWAYAVMCVSVLSKGYSFYAVDFRLHRSLVVLPPLLSVALLSSKKMLAKIPLVYLLLVFLVSFATGTSYHYRQIERRPANPHLALIRQLQLLEPLGASELVVTQAAAQTNNLISLHDTAQYFLPNLNVRNSINTEQIEDICSGVKNNLAWLLLDELSPNCMSQLTTQGSLLNKKDKSSCKLALCKKLILYP
jgi:hypothetical protein